MWLVTVFICLGWIVSLCLHEFGHALVAYWGGDTSVKDKGYLTLNPLKYTDPGLSLLLPIFFLLIGGIALPGGAVYINQNRLRDRTWKSAVSAAGPFANVILVLLLALPFLLGWNFDLRESQGGDLFKSFIYVSLAFIINLNIYVVLINLLPIPPLDGYGIIEPWLPHSIRPQLNQFGKYGIWVLIGLIWFVRPFNQFLWTITDTVSNILRIPTGFVVLGGSIFRQHSLFLVLVLVVVLWIFRDKKSELYRQAVKLMAAQKYEEAIAPLDRAIQIDPHYAEAWNLRAYALSCLKRQEEALADYEKALKIKPDSPEIWHDKGVLFKNLQRYEAAIAAYDRALEIQPNFPLAWRSRGLILFTLQRYEEAITAYDKAIQYQPNYPEAFIDRGNALVKLNRDAEAVADYNRAMKLQPNSLAWMYQAQILEKLHRDEEAIAVYDKRLRLKPDDVDAWYYRGLTLAKLQRQEEAFASYEQAIAGYDRILKRRPKDANKWYEKGYFLEKMQRDDAALVAYEKVTEIQPNFYQAWYSQGTILGKLQRYSEAIAAYDRVLEIRPNDCSIWFIRGQALATEQRYEQAIDSYDRAIAIYPDFYGFFLFQGNALYCLHRYEEAIAAYNRAIELQSNCANAWYNKACCYALQSNLTLAIQALQQAINLDSERLRELAKTDPDFAALQENQLFQNLLN